MSVTTKAHLKTEQGKALLDHCDTVLSKHGIDIARSSDTDMVMSFLDCSITVTGSANGLDVTIETPSKNLLSTLREEFIERINEVDPALAQTVRWSGKIDVGARPGNFRVLAVKARQELFPGLIRVTLKGTDVAALAQDGIHIKLMMPLQRGRTAVWPTLGANGAAVWPQGEDTLHARFVTIRHLRLEDQEIDVDVAHHAGGLISEWAAMDGVGDRVGVMGPGGDARLPETEGVILAADLTGLPAIARLIESVGGDAQGVVIAEIDSQAALETYLPQTKLRLVAIPSGNLATQAVEIARAHAAGNKVKYAWFGGEFETAQALRTVFKKVIGLTKHTQMSVAYWRRDVPGHTSREL